MQNTDRGLDKLVIFFSYWVLVAVFVTGLIQEWSWWGLVALVVAWFVITCFIAGLVQDPVIMPQQIQGAEVRAEAAVSRLRQRLHQRRHNTV